MIAKNDKTKKGKFRQFFKKLILSAVMVVLVCVVGALVVSNLEIKKNRFLLSQQAEELARHVQELKDKNEELKKDTGQIGSQEYLEKIAREQMNLKKPGEGVVIISKEKQEAASIAVSAQNKTLWQWIKSLLGF